MLLLFHEGVFRRLSFSFLPLLAGPFYLGIKGTNLTDADTKRTEGLLNWLLQSNGIHNVTAHFEPQDFL